VTSKRLLFRQEAVDFHSTNQRWGEVSALQPVSTKLITWFIAATVVVALFFLSIGQYARKETVLGYLTPSSGTSKIFAGQQGAIKEVHVNEGDKVEEGQPLLTVETNQIASDGRDVNATMLNTLNSQKDQLTHHISAEKERTNSERDRLLALMRGLEREVSQLQAQIEIQGERIQMIQELVSSAAGLRTKGYMSEVDFKGRQMAVLEQKQNLGALKQQLAARQGQLIENHYALEQLPTVMGGKVQSLRGELANTEERIAEINGHRAYVVRAPTAGRVSTLQARVGQFADPRRLQMEIIPLDTALEAHLFVPARAIGFVQPGESIRILYDAFPYQQFGTYGGWVTNVSQTILTGVDASGPISLKEPAYGVTAALDSSVVRARARMMPLQPDMLLRADIILEKRSLLRWFFDPVLRVRM